MGIKIPVSLHPWHLPEPLGMCEQPFLPVPDPGTEPFCNDSNTNRTSLSTVVRNRNSLVAPTCLACMKIIKNASKITPRITRFFIIITFYFRTKEMERKSARKGVFTICIVLIKWRLESEYGLIYIGGSVFGLVF